MDWLRNCCSKATSIDVRRMDVALCAFHGISRIRILFLLRCKQRLHARGWAMLISEW